MKLDKVKEAFSSVFEEDEALKYALATNIAKYGRPQSKPSDKPAKLTKGLEKKREKAVKDLKKAMDEQEGSPFPGPDMNNKGYTAARDLIDRLRATVFKKLNDDELEEFRKTLANAFDMSLKEGLIKEQADYKYLTQVILDANPKMNVYYSTSRNVVNIGGVGYDKGDLVKNFNQPQGSSGKIKNNFYYANKDPQITEREVERLSNGKIKVDIQKGYGNEPFVVYSLAESLNERLGVSKDKLSNIVKFVGAVNFAQMVISLKDENVQDEIVSAFEDQYPAVMDKRDDLQEDEGTLNKIADMLSRKFDDLRFSVNTMSDRIDVYGSQQDLMNFGTELHGKEIFDYEVFHTDDDDRGEIVRIVKSDSISRGGVNEEMDPKEMKTGTYAGKKVVIHMHGSETEWKVEFIDTGKIVDYIDVMANLKFDDGTTYMDYLKEKKDKADRCLRVARRKMPQSSAYRSGLIVKCRKGMIWKKEK